MSKVVIFGSLNMDLSMECEHAPAEAETVMGSHFVTTPGGKGANQAVASAHMGAETHLIGAVGKDEFGVRLTRNLIQAGVVCGAVRSCDCHPTGCALILRSGGVSRIVVDPGANVMTTADDVCAVLDRIAEPGDIYLSQLECNVDAAVDAIAYARESGLYTMLNAAPARKLPPDVYQSIDLLCVNERECEALCGVWPQDEPSAMRAMLMLSAMGAATVVVTMGRNGCAALIAGDPLFLPAVPLDVVDSTAAGDAFLGTLAAELSAGRDIDEGLVTASAAGAIACTRVGAQDAMPTEGEVRALLARLRP